MSRLYPQGQAVFHFWRRYNYLKKENRKEYASLPGSNFLAMRYLWFLVLLFTACKSITLPQDGTASLANPTFWPFLHGVASGDPTKESILLWTRVMPAKSGSLQVSWELATDSTMRKIFASGVIQTDSSKDYTVKVKIDRLNPGKFYYYRFKSQGKKSPVGRTKTLPASSAQVRLAFVSCSNWQWGYFNAYNTLSKKQLDAVVHLGDYIYEYGPDVYADTSSVRKHIPAKEIITLQDYRTRYAQYRLDPDLQEIHRLHPFFTIWDDHEIANNAYTEGAQNHQSSEGSYSERKEAAKKAYYEWLPVMDHAPIYKSVSLGSLVDLIILDERLAGRTRQPESIAERDRQKETLQMLGSAQLQWFEKKLTQSEAIWKVIGNQVIFSESDNEPMWGPNSKRNLDAWDGYPEERAAIITAIKTTPVKNVLFVSGDTHASWAYEIPTSIEQYKIHGNKAVVGIELGTTSISSSNGDEYQSAEAVELVEQKMMHPSVNPHLKFLNNRDHGYLLLTFNPEFVLAEWWYVATVKRRESREYLGKQFGIRNGSKELMEIKQ